LGKFSRDESRREDVQVAGTCALVYMLLVSSNNVSEAMNLT